MRSVSSDQRLDDVRFWEKEVDDKLSALKQETDALDMFRNRLQAAVEAYEEPLRIAQLCLANRFVDSNPQTEADLRVGAKGAMAIRTSPPTSSRKGYLAPLE